MEEKIIDNLQKKYLICNIPWTVHWELTYECNLQCVHCYTGSEQKKGGDLTLSQISEIAHQLKEVGVMSITLSGGDPFFRNDILEILEILCKDFFVVILSNATVIDSLKAKRLKELKVVQIEISLYAMDEDIHDSITGIKGSHRKTMKGIYCLLNEGVKVVVKCPVMKQNVSDYRRVMDFANNLKMRFSPSPFMSPGLDGSRDPYNNCVDAEKLQIYFQQWYKDNKEKLEEYKKPIPLNREFICSAGRTSCAIASNGDLKPCTLISVKLGNLLDKSFKELWRDKPKKFLQDMRDCTISDFSKCKNCKWVSWCTPCPGLNYLDRGNLFTAAETYCSKVEYIMNEFISKRKERKRTENINKK
jgi:radical SAM protein with 4Fe4S-binding SPASM domain